MTDLESRLEKLAHMIDEMEVAAKKEAAERKHEGDWIEGYATGRACGYRLAAKWLRDELK